VSRALPAGSTHRRVLFGALDADGWSWAGLKATFWFVAIIMLLGYIPDRAYYFTVNRTIDLGIMLWSPVNLCPAENGGVPCPAPAGAIVPWQLSPTQLDLPEGRAYGAAAQLGSTLLYVGGSNGSGPTTTTFTTKLANGTFTSWAAGPDLPAARQRAGVAVLNGSAYLIGGEAADGKPTNTVWELTADPTSGALGTWKPVADVTLPEARTGAAVLAVADGIVVAGGNGPDGKPSTKVWKSTADSKTGALGAFEAQPDLLDGVADASIAFQGTFVWVYGGTDANGPSGAVQRGTYGVAGSTPGASAAAGAVATPAPSGAAAVEGIQQWAVNNSANVAARTAASGFTANGSLYLVGGSDGTAPQAQLLWAVPDANGNLPDGWHHLDVTDLPAGGLQGASPIVSGSTAFLLGGQTGGGVLKSSIRASLAPQEPFFQLGAFGVVVPALQIPGEVGQQLGYLSAAGAGTLDFIILALIGWAYAHRPQVGAWWARRRGRRSA
jgi:hypothetical protein